MAVVPMVDGAGEKGVMAACRPVDRSGVARWAIRAACVLAVAACIGWGLNRSAAAFERNPRPAGFSLGMVQGALMPLALPNLLMGKDVVIYAPNNTGRTYKLGYALGVNLCGLVFFGVFFWRLARWARRRESQRT